MSTGFLKPFKIFEYFKCQIANNGIIFLQETHFSEDTFHELQDNLKGEVFFRMVQQVLAV